MRYSTLALIVAVILVAAFVAFRFLEPPSPSPKTRAVNQPAPPRPEEEPVVRYPVPEEVNASGAETGAEPPAAPESEPAAAGPDEKGDDFVRQVLADLVPGERLFALLLPENFIPRLVVIVDALPRKNVPRQHLPIMPPGGSFRVSGPEEDAVISPDNYDRYAPYVTLAEAVPTDALAATYFRLYPLFQEAYRKMGYPRGYFNDRLIAVLTHLLETPEVPGPIPVEAHVNRYVFRDKNLEARSAGQKVLLRMGPDNARRVKSRLQALRDALVAASEENPQVNNP